MSTVKDLMTTEMISVDPDDSVEEAISLMLKHGLSSLPVVDSSGKLLGIISEFDLLELVWDPKTSQDRIYHYMSRQVHKVREDTELGATAELFRILSVSRLPVTRDDRVVGIISRQDLLCDVLQVRGHMAPVVPRALSPTDAPFQTPAAFEPL